ncbi:hypothetical protein WOLCODRAFT_151804 [Wolfiporia cocos MD-104 SS10]|uniref:Uncharacterized protein n=1 Tax=Wolfiporia cocos (strain MD-104) TaxID=742152 RepID=A0A2H3JSH5_WOLCO|nr:hypothetical protein WOLCODRAFT_151804 [Wolfiporia cocos MD-104 SS10]
MANLGWTPPGTHMLSAPLNRVTLENQTQHSVAITHRIGHAEANTTFHLAQWELEESATVQGLHANPNLDPINSLLAHQYVFPPHPEGDNFIMRWVVILMIWGTKVDSWVTSFTKEYYQGGQWQISWDQFVWELYQKFDDPDLEKKAAVEAEHLKMEAGKGKEYFQKL